MLAVLAAVALAVAAAGFLFGLVFSSSSSVVTAALTTGFAVAVAAAFVGAAGLAGAGVSSGSGSGLVCVAGAAELFPAAQPNGFLVSVAGAVAAAAGAGAATVNCVLHDVQRIVLPARFSGTSNAALQPEQVIGMAMGSSARGRGPRCVLSRAECELTKRTTQPRSGIGAFSQHPEYPLAACAATTS